MRSMILTVCLALVLLSSGAVPALAMVVAEPTNHPPDIIADRIDYVNIGTPASEAGHNLLGWGPAEPAAHGGHWGYPDAQYGGDGACRAIYTPSDGDRGASFTMNFGGPDGSNKYLVLRHLDGHAKDSFYVNIDSPAGPGSHIYYYPGDNSPNEYWYTLFLPVNLVGVHTVYLYSDQPEWAAWWTSPPSVAQGWGVWGQVGFTWAAVERRTINAQTANPAGVTLTLDALALDNFDPNPTVTWSLGPTANFPIGTTPVTVTATDASGNSASKTVHVNVVLVPGPPANISLLPARAENVVGNNHGLTATVTDQYGNAVPGAPVSWSISGVGGFVGIPDPATDANGQARATIVSNSSGQSTVTATVTGTTISATAIKMWKPGPPANITLLPARAENVVGNNHGLTATVTDQYGNAVPGAPISWSISGVGSFVGTPDASTDSNGQAKATIVSNSSGQSTVTATVTGTTISATAIKMWKPVTVTIDIKPGSFPNSINLGSKGVIPVAILTTPGFDAASVNATTVRFGPTASAATAAPVQYAMEDVDGDGDMDMILHFRNQDAGLLPTSVTATLIGKTTSGLDFEGTDSVRIVPPK